MGRKGQYRHARSSAFAIVSLVMAGAAVSASLPASLAGASVAMVAVGAQVPSIPAGAQQHGALAASTSLHVSMVLRSADPAGLEALAREVSTPGSAQYREYLTPAEVQEHFGPPSTTVDAVRAWLTSQGLTVGATSADGLDIPASGSAAAVASAFEAPIDQYTLVNGRHVYANTTTAKVPEAIQPDVQAVLGLDNLVQPHDNLATSNGGESEHTGGAARSEIQGAAVPPSGGPAPCTTATNAAETSPFGVPADALADLYQFSPLYQQGKVGQGTTVAVFELADYADSDITTFEQCYGISTPVTRVPVDGGTTIGDSPSGVEEVTADIETVISLAPQTHVLVYEGPSTSDFASFYDTYAAIAQQDQAQVVSTSWGICESDEVTGGLNLATVEAPLFQEMALQGQSMVAAAGDQGSAGCVNSVGPRGAAAATAYTLGVVDPGSQPFVTGVGGTELASSGSGIIQKAWNETGVTSTGSGYVAPFDGATGRPTGYPGNRAGTGGISRYWQMPAWQVGADHGMNSSGTQCGAPAGVECREVPDVSANAGLINGYVLYGTAGAFAGAGWTIFGGTSLATPLWAALLALSDQGTPQGRLGLVSPALYRIAISDPSAFTDVTTGDNDYLSAAGSPTNDTCTYTSVGTRPCYQATVGYDMATGLGTPVGNTLAGDLDALQVGITTSSLPAGSVGRPYSATVTAAGGTTPYTWAVTSGALPSGLSIDPRSGVIAGTPTVSGTSAFTVQVTDTGQGLTSTGIEPPSAVQVSFSITIAAAGGYWLAASDGGIFAYGSAIFYGSMGGQPLNKPIVGVAPTTSSGGYWEVASDGGIFAFGDATFYGSMGGKPLNKPIVGIVPTPDSRGYWEVASDGGIFAFGNATFYGSMGGQPLNKPIVAITATPDGKGYWEVASDGGIFAFGDATFYGSMGGTPLNKPIADIARTPSGHGYWEVATDGGIFSFGDATFYGSTAGLPLAESVVGMSASGDGGGYWLVAADGGVFTFGDAPFDGSAGSLALAKPIVAMATSA